MSYRKRDIAHWNQGKSCKGTRKAKEREFVERDIQQQIDELHPDFLYRHKAKRTPNLEARLKGRIEWYELRVAEHERQAKLHKDHWSCSWASYARSALREARQELKELQEKKDVEVQPQRHD